MPELPEVETIRRGLAAIAPPGSVIETVQVRRRDLRRPVPSTLTRRLRQARLETLRRWGKYLLWDTSAGVLVCHLGMSGTWRLTDRRGRRPHDHLVLILADGRQLAYNDPRRFGFIDLVAQDRQASHPSLSRLGPDALAYHSTSYLKERLAGRRGPIKNALLDQAVVAGIGNIYANEALFRAAIRPRTAAGRISQRRLTTLQDTVRQVLEEAICAGGSTLKDFRQTDGDSGYFQHRFKVYGRAGLPCLACGRPLTGELIAGRPTVWCGACQR